MGYQPLLGTLGGPAGGHPDGLAARPREQGPPGRDPLPLAPSAAPRRARPAHPRRSRGSPRSLTLPSPPAVCGDPSRLPHSRGISGRSARAGSRLGCLSREGTVSSRLGSRLSATPNTEEGCGVWGACVHPAASSAPPVRSEAGPRRWENRSLRPGASRDRDLALFSLCPATPRPVPIIPGHCATPHRFPRPARLCVPAGGGNTPDPGPRGHHPTGPPPPRPRPRDPGSDGD